MATQTLKCERHGELTRLTCVDCGKPVCPKCAVRTDAGLKCEADAQIVKAPEPAPEVVRPSRKPLYLGLAGAAVTVVLIIVILVLAGGDGGDDPAPAMPPIGSWAEAPALSTIRGSTTAVVLEDGKVLVAGGGVGAIPITASELFDPVSNSWSSSADLAEARRGHRAVRLADGRVLVAGGRNAEGNPSATAELYDPATGGWEAVEPMSLGRIGHGMTLLSDGRVLVTGGTALGRGGAGGGQTIRPDPSAEIYDPATGAWVGTSPMSTPRFEHSATLLADGKVLIVGGQGPAEDAGGRLTALASTELFDPAAGGFVTSTPLSEGRANHAAVGLVDQSVLVVGGAGGNNADRSLASVELFEPRTGSWTTIEDLTTERTGHTATLLADGRVLVAGGEVRQGSRTSLGKAEIYDPQGREWRSAGEMSCPRSEHAAVLLGDGTVLVMAGDTAFPGQTPIAQGCVDRYKP